MDVFLRKNFINLVILEENLLILSEGIIYPKNLLNDA
jgi:hypothetical protein